MPAPGFMQVSDLRDMLRAITDHTRPAFDQEILAALNYGYQTVCRAIMSVRSQFFQAVVDPFTIPAVSTSPPSAVEIDLSGIEPPLWRPIRLVATGSSAGRGAIFRYRSLVSIESVGSEQQAYSGGYNCFYYDILSGRIPLPQSNPVYVFGTLGTNTISLTAPMLQVGQFLEIYQNASIQPPVDVSAPGYYGRVMSGTGPPPFQEVVVAPDFVSIAQGSPVTILRSSVMRVANPTSQSVTGRLYYQYRPRRFKDFDEYLDPVITDFSDLIVHYAISQYLLAVNDADSNAWLQKAQLLRSELMQDLEPMSGDSSEGLGSDLWGSD